MGFSKVSRPFHFFWRGSYVKAMGSRAATLHGEATAAQVPQAKFSYDLSPVEVVISYSRRRCHGAMGGVQKYRYFEFCGKDVDNIVYICLYGVYNIYIYLKIVVFLLNRN